jgi:hypothetical protein
MSAEGLVHFDAHLRNVVVDGDRLYLTDFGLAMSSAFSLSVEEARFLRRHAEHDLAYVVTELVNWAVTHLTEASGTWRHPSERNAYVAACAGGHSPPELPAHGCRPGAALRTRGRRHERLLLRPPRQQPADPLPGAGRARGLPRGRPRSRSAWRP